MSNLPEMPRTIASGRPEIAMSPVDYFIAKIVVPSVKKAVWQTPLFFGSQYVIHSVAEQQVDASFASALAHSPNSASQQQIAEYVGAMHKLEQGTELHQLTPDLQQPVENIGFGLILLHLVAKSIKLDSNHSNSLVQATATIDNSRFARAARFAYLFTLLHLPNTLPLATTAFNDLISYQENAPLDIAILGMAIMGGITTAIDLCKILSKSIELTGKLPKINLTSTRRRGSSNSTDSSDHTGSDIGDKRPMRRVVLSQAEEDLEKIKKLNMRLEHAKTSGKMPPTAQPVSGGYGEVLVDKDDMPRPNTSRGNP